MGNPAKAEIQESQETKEPTDETEPKVHQVLPAFVEIWDQ